VNEQNMSRTMELKDDWEFNVLGIYNYRKPGPLSHYIQFIIENHEFVEGDIVEAGVFNGRSLLSIGLLLKEQSSPKQVYGYDTFAGFPNIFNINDDFSKFEELFSDDRISKIHLEKIRKNIDYRSLDLPNAVSPDNISLSGNFSNNSISTLQKKIDFLGLDNVHLVPGHFHDTMTDSNAKTNTIMATLLDCDLYQSYIDSLPFIWKRLSKGGYIYLDEYYSLKFPGARIATDEFFSDKRDKPQQHEVELGDFERWYVRKRF